MKILLALDLPHARGDGPMDRALRGERKSFAPRTWGWTAVQRSVYWRTEICPTHVGMDRSPRPEATRTSPFAPRTWGWTDRGRGNRGHRPICPTHVGMDRTTRSLSFVLICICPTHVGMDREAGGVKEPLPPICPTHVGMDRIFSAIWTSFSSFAPRTWGWTGADRLGDRWRNHLPHARGDGPHREM